jgi:hypothetical protein
MALGLMSTVTQRATETHHYAARRLTDSMCSMPRVVHLAVLLSSTVYLQRQQQQLPQLACTLHRPILSHCSLPMPTPTCWPRGLGQGHIPGPCQQLSIQRLQLVVDALIRRACAGCLHRRKPTSALEWADCSCVPGASQRLTRQAFWTQHSIHTTHEELSCSCSQAQVAHASLLTHRYTAMAAPSSTCQPPDTQVHCYGSTKYSPGPRTWQQPGSLHASAACLTSGDSAAAAGSLPTTRGLRYASRPGPWGHSTRQPLPSSTLCTCRGGGACQGLVMAGGVWEA